MQAHKISSLKRIFNLVRWCLAILLTCLALSPHRVSASVTISSFDAKWQGSQVVIHWRTATELNNVGFFILRNTSSSGNYQKITANLIPANLGSVTGSSYSYTDSAVTPGTTYYYKLQSYDGRSTQDYGPVTAAPAATATATRTATPIPATSTRTLTPTPSSTPLRTSTPTITPTYQPGITPPTPLPTSTPQPTPTRTQTYLPSVKPPTAAPSTTTQRIVQVQPVSTAKPIASAVMPTVSEGSSVFDSTSAQGASPSTDTTVLPDEHSDDFTDTSTDQNSSTDMLFRLGVIVVSGALGLGALLFGALAIFLFIRFSRNGS